MKSGCKSTLAYILLGVGPPKYLRLSESVLNIIHYANNILLSIAAICHGPQILVAAGVIKGKKLTGYFTLKPEVEMAGGQRVIVAEDEAVQDGNLVTTASWMGNPAILRQFISLIDTSIIH